jgi:hypothetical protein
LLFYSILRRGREIICNREQRSENRDQRTGVRADWGSWYPMSENLDLGNPDLWGPGAPASVHDLTGRPAHREKTAMNGAQLLKIQLPMAYGDSSGLMSGAPA